jgi:hypothetical protein
MNTEAQSQNQTNESSVAEANKGVDNTSENANAKQNQQNQRIPEPEVKLGVQNQKTLDLIAAQKASKRYQEAGKTDSSNQTQEESEDEGLQFVDANDSNQIKSIAERNYKQVRKLKKENVALRESLKISEAKNKMNDDYALLSRYGVKLDDETYDLAKKLCGGDITEAGVKTWVEKQQFSFMLTDDVSPEETKAKEEKNQNPFWLYWNQQNEQEQKIRDKVNKIRTIK